MAREFKDSGIEWIGQIPKEWEVCRFKNFLSLFSIPSTSEKKIGLENIESETGKFIKTEGKFEGNGTHFCKGDILYGKLRPYLKKVWVSTFEGNAVGDFFVFRVKDNACSNYIKWLLLSDGYTEAVNSSVYGAKMPRVSSEFIMTLPFYLPSFSEQQKIADYLDKVCGEVDEMVTLQETMIEELKAYKQSVITEAVTKGLNPNVPMRNSGIDWIGEIPKHWKKNKVCRMFKLIGSGTTPSSSDNDAFGGKINWIQSGDINGGDLIESKNKISEKTLEKYSALTLYNAPFIIVAMYGASVGNISISRIDGCVNQACCVLSDSTIDFNYAFYTIKAAQKYLIYKAVGGGQPNISQFTLKQLWLPEPPISEQRAIASFLDTKCSEIDSLIALKQAKIEELKEYKKSVIYEYVTGKKEVC